MWLTCCLLTEQSQLFLSVFFHSPLPRFLSLSGQPVNVWKTVKLSPVTLCTCLRLCASVSVCALKHGDTLQADDKAANSVQPHSEVYTPVPTSHTFPVWTTKAALLHLDMQLQPKQPLAKLSIEANVALLNSKHAGLFHFKTMLSEPFLTWMNEHILLQKAQTAAYICRTAELSS